MSEIKPTLTVEETAKLLGISRGLAFQAVRSGDIPRDPDRPSHPRPASTARGAAQG